MQNNVYKGRCRTRKDKIALILLIVLFFSLAVPAAIAGNIQDGPQLDMLPAASDELVTEETDFDVQLDERLSLLSSGAGGSAMGDDIHINQPMYAAPAPAPEQEYIPDPDDVTMIAKLMYGEGRGIWSLTKQAAIAWSVLNRVDSTGYAMGHDVEYVVTFEDQFLGYKPWHPTIDDYGRDLKWLAADVLTRWHLEKMGEIDVGRVLPAEYKWFDGDGKENYFRDTYKRTGANTWDWSLPSPYES